MAARLPDGRVLVAGGAGEMVHSPDTISDQHLGSGGLVTRRRAPGRHCRPCLEPRAGGATVSLPDGSVPSSAATTSNGGRPHGPGFRDPLRARHVDEPVPPATREQTPSAPPSSAASTSPAGELQEDPGQQDRHEPEVELYRKTPP
jgi:hypothetical protein